MKLVTSLIVVSAAFVASRFQHVFASLLRSSQESLSLAMEPHRENSTTTSGYTASDFSFALEDIHRLVEEVESEAKRASLSRALAELESMQTSNVAPPAQSPTISRLRGVVFEAVELGGVYAVFSR